MQRRRDSVRFDPYYKLQIWTPHVLAWMDVQRSFPSVDDAQAAAPAGKRVRIMRISMGAREVVASDGLMPNKQAAARWPRC